MNLKLHYCKITVYSFILIPQKVNNNNMIDSIIHFLKHVTGLCGESHPSILMGGVAIAGLFTYCISKIKNLIKRK